MLSTLPNPVEGSTWTMINYKIDVRCATGKERNWLAEQMVVHGRKAAAVIGQVSLPVGEPGAISKQYLHKQCVIYRKKGLFHDTKGRPPLIPHDKVRKVMEDITAESSFVNIKKQKVEQRLEEAAQEILAERNKHITIAPPGSMKPKACLSQRTIYRLVQKERSKTSNADQKKTKKAAKVLTKQQASMEKEVTDAIQEQTWIEKAAGILKDFPSQLRKK